MSERRRFLRLVGGAGAALFCGCSNGEGAAEASGSIPGGTVQGTPVGSLALLAGYPVAVGRDSGGFYAMTTICTHLQCDMSVHGELSTSGLHCTCHGSEFDRNGAVLQGPASTPLRHWQVELTSDGDIIVHAGVEVSATTRVPAP